MSSRRAGAGGADRNKRRTEIAVAGDVAEDCLSLSNIIHAHLTVLAGKVPVIDPEKWVPITDLRGPNASRSGRCR